MGMNINRDMGFKKGEGLGTDVRSVSNDAPKSDSDHIEQMRQKIGTGFTAAKRAKDGKAKNELGKDDFMKLMSAQLKHQDPISPMKNQEMAAQLAQFSALEQMMNVNQNLEKMAAGQKPSEHMIAASLIGKRVTTDQAHIALEKDGQPEVPFTVPADAKQVNLAIVDQKGEVVRELELGEMKQGPQSVRWDGKNKSGMQQPKGEYSYKITGLDTEGKPMNFNADSSGIVTGVSFEAGKSMLHVDGKKIPIEKIGKIEADLPKAGAVGAGPGKEGELLAAQAAVNPLAASAPQAKQNSSSTDDKNTSTQVAKNNLPPGFSPEKIKNMLAASGLKGEIAKAGGESSAEENNSSDAADEKIPDPLWNPASN